MTAEEDTETSVAASEDDGGVKDKRERLHSSDERREANERKMIRKKMIEDLCYSGSDGGVKDEQRGLHRVKDDQLVVAACSDERREATKAAF
ncbi:hypothetical protein SESBI_35465 [Sesbania bispinosa]|nr:hypothetical protein SESBI_35465 [Sesbania bispinosa]